MKITLVSPYAWTTPGGVNAHIGALARHLRARGHEVRILAPADGPVEAGVIALGRTLGVPYNGAVARMAFGPRIAGRVRVALRRARPDVIHVHEPFAPSAGMLAVIAARVPVVATFHAAADSRTYRTARIPLGPLWRKIAVRIAVSAAARDTVESVFGPGARIVANGIDTERFLAVPPPEPDARTVLFMGRLEPRKGIDVLLEALPALRAEVPGVRVVIAGDGPQRKDLEKMVAPENQDIVTFFGAFDEEQRMALLTESSLVCLPALGGESFGYTLVEAMAAGRAVVASANSGYAAVARDGVDGLLVAPGDSVALASALSRVLRAPEERVAMGVAGRRRAEVFDWARIAGTIEDAYREAQDPTAVARAATGRKRRTDPDPAEPL